MLYCVCCTVQTVLTLPQISTHSSYSNRRPQNSRANTVHSQLPYQTRTQRYTISVFPDHCVKRVATINSACKMPTKEEIIETLCDRLSRAKERKETAVKQQQHFQALR